MCGTPQANGGRFKTALQSGRSSASRAGGCRDRSGLLAAKNPSAIHVPPRAMPRRRDADATALARRRRHAQLGAQNGQPVADSHRPRRQQDWRHCSNRWLHDRAPNRTTTVPFPHTAPAIRGAVLADSGRVREMQELATSVQQMASTVQELCCSGELISSLGRCLSPTER